MAAAYLAAGNKAKAKDAAETIEMAEKNPGLKEYVEEQAKKYGVRRREQRRRTREENEPAGASVDWCEIG